MPYQLRGTSIYHYKGGRWSLKSRHATKAKAEVALRILRAYDKKKAGGG